MKITQAVDQILNKEGGREWTLVNRKTGVKISSTDLESQDWGIKKIITDPEFLADIKSIRKSLSKRKKN